MRSRFGSLSDLSTVCNRPSSAGKVSAEFATRAGALRAVSITIDMIRMDIKPDLKAWIDASKRTGQAALNSLPEMRCCLSL